ncbi:MAG: rod shape-determining protein MreD [Planctomycetes bacterium]|nr:rod shape-determining protein MreD [Planctomycetota bacterium]
MRWLSFTFLMLALVLIQVGVCQPFALGLKRITPDLLVVLVVVLAFWPGGEDEVLVACWVLGLMKDLISAAPFGCYAFSFGLLAMLIRQLREMIYGDRLLPMMLVTVLGSFGVEQTVYMLSHFKGIDFGGQYRELSKMMLFSAMLSALLLPYINWLVQKIHRRLGLPRGRSY